MSSESAGQAVSPATVAPDLHQMAAAGRLLAGVVHEISTPLGSIFCNTEVIQRSLEKLAVLLAVGGPEGMEKARGLVVACQSLAAVDRLACERIRAVVRGLKSFSRADDERPRPIDLNQQLRDSLKLARAEFGSRIRVQADLADLPPVDCYPQMLGQVFLNLLVNAAHAIEGHGLICARTRLEPGVVHISISDSGCGMAPAEKARAFEAGFTTKPVGEGCGMGLAIAKEIVEDRHGGTIACESEPGSGATFHVRIPVRRQPVAEVDSLRELGVAAPAVVDFRASCRPEAAMAAVSQARPGLEASGTAGPNAQIEGLGAPGPMESKRES